ncbi:MAG: MBL fold metallo-hydrolase [Bdellovibrionota bacterium]
MRKFLKILAGLLGTLVALVLIFGMFLFGGQQNQGQGPALPQGVTAIKDGMVTAFALDAGPKGVVLIDAGNDPKGVKLLAGLAALGKHPEEVSAIFVTHAHGDHIAGLPLFPKAEIYTMAEEVPYASGAESFKGALAKIFAAKVKTPFHVTHPLRDGESVQIGNLHLTAYGVPGHTAGSAAYLARGVLFLGDAACASKTGELLPPVGPFSDDQAQGIQSLKNLAERLGSNFQLIATAHNGNLGREALMSFHGTK